MHTAPEVYLLLLTPNIHVVSVKHCIAVDVFVLC